MNRWDPETYVAGIDDVCGIWHSKLCDPIREIREDLRDQKLPTAVDIGTGSGKFACIFALLGWLSYAVDNNQEMLNRVQRNFPHVIIHTRYAKAPDLIDLMPRRRYDLVFSEGLVEHFLDDEERKRCLRKMWELSRRWVYIIVPYKHEAEDEIYIDNTHFIENELPAFEEGNIVTYTFRSQDGSVKHLLMTWGRVK